jgi:hypothetical protein
MTDKPQTKAQRAAAERAAGKRTEKRIAAAVRTLAARVGVAEFEYKEIEAKASGSLVVLPGIWISPDVAERIVALLKA